MFVEPQPGSGLDKVAPANLLRRLLGWVGKRAVAGTIGGLVLLVIIAVAVVMMRRRRRILRPGTPPLHGTPPTYGSPGPPPS